MAGADVEDFSVHGFGLAGELGSSRGTYTGLVARPLLGTTGSGRSARGRAARYGCRPSVGHRRLVSLLGRLSLRRYDVGVLASRYLFIYVETTA